MASKYQKIGYVYSFFPPTTYKYTQEKQRYGIAIEVGPHESLIIQIGETMPNEKISQYLSKEIQYCTEKLPDKNGSRVITSWLHIDNSCRVSNSKILFALKDAQQLKYLQIKISDVSRIRNHYYTQMINMEKIRLQRILKYISSEDLSNAYENAYHLKRQVTKYERIDPIIFVDNIRIREIQRKEQEKAEMEKILEKSKSNKER